MRNAQRNAYITLLAGLLLTGTADAQPRHRLNEEKQPYRSQHVIEFPNPKIDLDCLQDKIEIYREFGFGIRSVVTHTSTDLGERTLSAVYVMPAAAGRRDEQRIRELVEGCRTK